MSKAVEHLVSHFKQVRKTGDGNYVAQCPRHGDSNRYLRIEVGREIVIRCTRNCDLIDIIEASALEEDDFWRLLQGHKEIRSLTPMTFQRWSEVDRFEYEPIWEYYLYDKVMTVLAGYPEQGKSWMLCWIAAHLTTGRALPGQEAKPPMNVLFMSGEDDVGAALVDRVEAMGGDISRLWQAPTIVSDEGHPIPFSISRHMDQLARFIEAHDIQLVIMDPFESFIGGSVDLFRSNQVREVLMMVKEVLKDHHFGLLGTMHFSKSTNQENPVYKIMNSSAFSQVVRLILFMGGDHETPLTRKHLVVGKCNITAYGKSHFFDLKGQGRSTALVYGGVSPYTKDDIAKSKPQDEVDAIAEAKEFCLEHLANMPRGKTRLTSAELAKLSAGSFKEPEIKKALTQLLRKREVGYLNAGGKREFFPMDRVEPDPAPSNGHLNGYQSQPQQEELDVFTSF